MSQDNENKSDDLDFNFNFDEENNENGIDALFSDNPLNSLSDETELPESENLGEVPSTFLTNNEPEETALPEINIDTVRKNSKTSGKKKKKEEKRKEKGESIEIGAGLCLTAGGFLLLALITINIILLVFQPYKELGVGFSSTIYYLLGFDFVGGAGIVAVPFLFYKYRKENDLFQTLLGVSVMALSLAVLILMTEFFYYNYTRIPASALPTLAPVVLSNAAPAE
ncbi:MAG: hypothetical protein LBF88_04015 [Planctomycetaceae bacterium]|nr:hypothetical protein [Planctomycetaceae bacterium]